MVRSAVILVLPLLVFVGCGKGSAQIAPVHGRVTLNGQPLAMADVSFQPTDARRVSTGRTDADGRYELLFKRGQKGALVGSHTVRIWVSPEVMKNPPIIAARFDTKTELKRDVKLGENEFDFDVTTEK